MSEEFDLFVKDKRKAYKQAMENLNIPTSNFELVKKWHEAFGVNNAAAPTLGDTKLRDFRMDLIEEETEEVEEALGELDIRHIAKELGDLLWVTYGALAQLGIDADRVMQDIYESNMSKLENGEVVYRDDGKVLKGKAYQEPKFDWINDLKPMRVVRSDEINDWQDEDVQDFAKAYDTSDDSAVELEEEFDELDGPGYDIWENEGGFVKDDLPAENNIDLYVDFKLSDKPIGISINSGGRAHYQFGGKKQAPDMVNHPKHYVSHPSGIEAIQVCQWMTFNIGSAMKYLFRAGLKGDIIEDLNKAIKYLEFEVERLSNAGNQDINNRQDDN